MKAPHNLLRVARSERALRASHAIGARRRSGARERVLGSPRGEAPRKLLTLILAMLGVAALAQTPSPSTPPGRWTEQQANEWYKRSRGWSAANYIPASAINELEMWQADTFDPKRIDKELGWAAGIGMNTMRVFLHDLLWQQDADGFKKRHRSISRHRRRSTASSRCSCCSIRCWDPNPEVGPAARAEARRAQLRLAAEPGRQGAAGPEGVLRVSKPMSRASWGVRQGHARPRLGRVERAGQHERIQLRRAGAGEQGGARAEAAAAGVRVGARAPGRSSR